MPVAGQRLQSRDAWWAATDTIQDMCEKPVARYIYKTEIADHSGQLRIDVFDEVGMVLFGCEAQELAALWDECNANPQCIEINWDSKGHNCWFFLSENS